jgi:ParB/RepB/Spo0J family partition protein
MTTRKTKDLKPSSFIKELYGDFSLVRDEDRELFNSIRTEGILQPLIVSKKNEIISGYRRHEIAKELGLEEVPVIIQDVNEVSEVLIIQHNLQRVKNEVQLTYEYELLRKILGSKQGVKLPKETKELLDKTKKECEKLVSASTQKRIVRAVNLTKTLNPRMTEKEAWKKVKQEVEKGKTPNAILTRLEKEEAIVANDRAAKKFEDFEVEEFRIINEDSKEAHKLIKKGSVQNLTSSPPYWNFRNYDGREKAKTSYPLGEEPTPQQYVKSLGDIIIGYKSALKKGSSVFINVMDKSFGISPSDIPFHLSDYLKKNGFVYRQPILWFKRNPPFSGNDRLAQPSMEHILHFTIGDDEEYYWNENAFNEHEFNLIHEALYGGEGKRKLLRNLIIPPINEFPEGGNVVPGLIETNVYNPHHLNKLLEEQGFVLTHRALYDYEIPMLLILPTTKKGDTCLDIFNGLGTTGLVAYATKRSYIGVELSELYAVQTKARFKALFLKEKSEQIQESKLKKTSTPAKKGVPKKTASRRSRIT